MTDKNNLLLEFAVREIWKECQFADIAYFNIIRKGETNTDVVFSSIHSFLSHCANISKLLWSEALAIGIDLKTVAEILNISSKYKIKNRSFRNILEHYDRELKKWIRKMENDFMIFDHNIGPIYKIKIPKNSLYVRHFDSSNNTFILLGKKLNLEELHGEVLVIRSKADHYIKNTKPGVKISKNKEVK